MDDGIPSIHVLILLGVQTGHLLLEAAPTTLSQSKARLKKKPTVKNILSNCINEEVWHPIIMTMSIKFAEVRRGGERERKNMGQGNKHLLLTIGQMMIKKTVPVTDDGWSERRKNF